MKRVYEARDITEAEFVKGLLAAEEIHAVVQTSALESILGDVVANSESLPSVWVPEEDETRSLVVISEMKQGGPAALEPRPAWTCPNCGETVEGQFTQCWKCGTARPAEPTDSTGKTL